MPIYEYTCVSCGHEFEELVRIGDTPPCPACGAQSPRRRRSMVSISTSGTRDVARKSGRRIAGNQRRERQHADAEYVRKHHDDHH